MAQNGKIQLALTRRAFRHLSLIQKNDSTTQGQVFRIQITGKGCEGMVYGTSFSHPRADDHHLSFSDGKGRIRAVMDPFCAFYLRRGKIDYVLDPESGEDGLVVENFDQEVTHGKFWKNAPELVPKL